MGGRDESLARDESSAEGGFAGGGKCVRGAAPPEGIVGGRNFIRKAEVASSVGVRKGVLGDAELRGICTVDGGRCLPDESGAS